MIDVYCDLFAGNEQHDSQEFMLFILDRLHKDMNSSRLPKLDKLKDEEIKKMSVNDFANISWKSIIVNLFQVSFL